MEDRKKKIEEFLISDGVEYKGWRGKHNICAGYGQPWINSYCIYCTYFDFENQNCPAYPDVIPERFAWGLEKHRNVEKDQKGKKVFCRDWNLSNDV